MFRIQLAGCIFSSQTLFFLHQDAEIGLPDNEENSVQEENAELCTQDARVAMGTEQDTADKVYLELVPVPVRSFLHTSCSAKPSPHKDTPGPTTPTPTEEQQDLHSQIKEVGERMHLVAKSLVSPIFTHGVRYGIFGTRHL